MTASHNQLLSSLCGVHCSVYELMKLSMPVICNYYCIRNPKFNLPPIKHAFAEQMIQYCLINQLNKDKSASDIINCIQQQTYCKFT